MALVFAVIVIANAWLNTHTGSALSATAFGVASVFVWALTLLGAFGAGPMGPLRKSLGA